MNGESALFSKLAEHVEKECRFHGVVSRRDARPPSQFPTYNFPHVIAHRISSSLVTSGDAPRHKLEIKRNQGGESCCRFERLRF